MHGLCKEYHIDVFYFLKALTYNYMYFLKPIFWIIELILSSYDSHGGYRTPLLGEQLV